MVPAVPAGICVASIQVFSGAGLGQVSGDLVVRLDGQEGNDVIAVDLAFANGGRGNVAIDAVGGLGNGLLSLVALGPRDPLRQQLKIDGGAGFDIGGATTNVEIVNCEFVIRLR